MALPRMIGGGDFGGFGGYDWLREKRRVDQQPIRGTQIAVTPNSAKATICGRLIDSSVVAGGMGGLPIASGSVGVNNGIPMPAAIKSAGPKINSATQGALQAGGATGAASIPLGVILGDWTDNHAPSWFLGCRLYLRLHGAVNGNPEGDITPGQSATFNTVGGGMGSAQIYDFGLSYLDGAGGESVITWPPGWASIEVPGIGNGGLQNAPDTIMNTGPTCTSSYTTGILKRGIYFTEIVTFTESDFSALPSWFDHAAAVVRINGDTAHVLEYPIPNSSWLVNAQDMYATIRVPHHAGQTIDVGLRYYDTSGQASPTTYPAGTLGIPDQAGDYFDSGNSYFTPVHNRMSVPVLGTISGAADAFGAYTKYGVIHRLHFDSAGQPGGTNLIYNPTASNGFVGWTRFNNGGNIMPFTFDAFGGGRWNTGSASLPAGDYDGWRQQIALPFNGQNMVLSGVVNGNTLPAGVSIYVDVLNAAQSASLATFTMTTTGTTQPFAVAFSSGTNASCWVRFYIWNQGASAATCQGLVQKLQLEYGTQPSAFVDHLANANHNKVFDANAKMVNSSSLNNQGSLLNIKGNPGWSHTAPSSTSTTLSIASAAFTLTDGSIVTPAAFSQTFTGLTNGGTYYVDISLDVVNVRYLVNGQPQGSAALLGNGVQRSTANQFSDCYIDGVVPLEVNTSFTQLTSGGGTGGGGSGSGGSGSCPAIWQKVRTKERGLIRADEVDIGDHLPTFNGGWCEVIGLCKKYAPLWLYAVTDGRTEESFDVNDTHAIRSAESGEWLMVRDLHSGDRLIGVNGDLVVSDAHHIGEDYYIAIEVKGHEYLLGDCLMHNPITF